MFVNFSSMYRILLTILLSSTLMSNIKVGDDAPTFFLRDLAEKNFFFSDSLKLGRPTVLSFFATHCIPCRAEMPQLDTLSRKYTNVNFYLVDVSGKIKEDPVCGGRAYILEKFCKFRHLIKRSKYGYSYINGFF